MLRTLRLIACACLPVLIFGLSPLLAPAAYSATSTVLYVDVNVAAGTHDGNSWATAYTALQEALDWTNSHGTSTFEIRVAEGVYYPDLGTGHTANAQSESFRISYDNVEMYGGFGGTETLRTQRNPADHPTVLSGDIDGNDTNSDGNFVAETSADIQGTNAIHVLYLDGETNENLTNTTVVDGFIITAGSATGADYWEKGGGGLYCAAGDIGKGCSPTIAQVTFSGNYALGNGAGMLNNGAAWGESSPVVTNVAFTGNKAEYGSGGGMSNYAANGTSSPKLTNVIFRGNVAYSGGAMTNYGSSGTSSPVLVNVIFSGNMADGAGGGMYSYGHFRTSSPVLINVTFGGNQATRGGGMYNAGMYSGGVSYPVLINVTFGGNQASYGGGMYNNGSFGGSNSPKLMNVIMWGDSASDGPEIYNESATPIITYSDIDQDGITGTGNIRQDPQFAAPVNATSAPTSAGNYHLLLGSPAADTGADFGADLSCPDVDLDGLSRPWDGNGDGSAICDMGAYEAQVLFVDKDTPGGTHDGKAWPTAYTTLQEALDWTNAHGKSIFEIWVAEGVYYPDLGGSHEADSQSESFRISYNNVQVYGGFAGTETARSQRDPGVHSTILSGDIDGNDTNNDTNFVAETSTDIQGSNAYHVVYLDGQSNEPLTDATVLDGFIVTGGSATGINADTIGGGLYCAGSGAGRGCSPTIARAIFSGNLAGNGGGMYNNGTNGGAGSATLTNVTFTGNKATGSGGGMFNYGDSSGASSPVLANVTFASNMAGLGGGGGMFNYAGSGVSSPVLTNVTFKGNTADDYGGGMYNYANGGTSSPQLVNVIMWDDSASTDSEIFSNGGTPIIAYSDIDQDGITGIGNFRADPLLSGLADHGGGMLTFALLPGSPAIDSGDSGTCAAAPVNNLDQRGVSRPQGSGCDRGAFESRGFSLTTAEGSPQQTPIFSPFALPLAVLAGSVYAEPLGPSGVITLTPPAADPGLSVTAPFTVTTNAAGLAASGIITANGVAGSFTVTATVAGAATPAVFSLTNVLGAPPQARADVGAVLQDTPLLIDVLANDIPGTSPQMFVYTATQPIAGGSTSIEQNKVRFTPAAGFTGLVTFNCTIHDANGLASSAAVAVRVTALNTTDGEPQVLSLPDPTDNGGGTVTIPAGTTEIEVPADAITPMENPLSTYDLVYHELTTPEPPPPGTLFTFGGRGFVLQLFIDAVLQPSYAFSTPIFVTLSYDHYVVTDTSKLTLYSYDEGRQEWATDGISIISVDTQNHTFRASIAHLTEFAVGIMAPTASDPSLEPQILPQLFLPQIQP